MARETRPGRERGLALVGALWAVMVLSLAASSVVTTSLTEARLTRSRIKSAELSAAADAVVNIVLLRLLSLDRALYPLDDGTPFSIEFANYSARVSVQDEGGKIDLNLADRDLLIRLIVSRGAGSADAEALVDRILDWRETGVGKRLLGAKMEYYRAAGIPYGPSDEPFKSVEELRLVTGVTPDLFDTLAPLLTVYGQNAWPNRDTVPAEILRALPGMNTSQVDAVLAARAATRAKLPALSMGRNVVSISVLISQGKVQATRTAAVRLTGILDDPIWVYRWS